jgi:hypothetical protein
MITFIVLAALPGLGISAEDFLQFLSAAKGSQHNEKIRRVLRIEWKPIIIFSEEAARFQRPSP